MDRCDDTPYLKVEGFDHALIDFLGAAVEVDEAVACKALRFRVVCGRFPRPVRRVEVQAEQKRAAGLRIAVHDIHRVAAEQFGEVAHLVDRHIVVVGPGCV